MIDIIGLWWSHRVALNEWMNEKCHRMTIGCQRNCCGVHLLRESGRPSPWKRGRDLPADPNEIISALSRTKSATKKKGKSPAHVTCRTGKLSASSFICWKYPVASSAKDRPDFKWPAVLAHWWIVLRPTLADFTFRGRTFFAEQDPLNSWPTFHRFECSFRGKFGWILFEFYLNFIWILLKHFLNLIFNFF